MTRAEFFDVLIHALRDTLPMVPLLFVLYTALELLSHHSGSRLLLRSALPKAFGPVAGALLGIIPQCGMSVFATSLYLSGRVTTGTLIATYLATSDEAIPVLLADGRRLGAVIDLILIKLVVGIIAGLIVDASAWRVAVRPEPAPSSRSRIQLHVETELHEAPWSRAMLHSLRRTLEIFGWVLLATSVIGLLVEWIGLTRIAAGTKRHPMLELLGTAFFGLIPNCSASIAIAEAYLRGVLSFSAAVAGLSAGAGYGPILLLRRGLLAKGIRLMAICLAFSIAAGLAVRLLQLE